MLRIGCLATWLIFLGEDGDEADSQSLILLQHLNAAWQSAHSHLCGLYLHDLGVYVVRSGLVLEPTSPTSAPDRSCSSVVLHVKASFVKHESSIPSAWTVGLHCPAKAIVALHGERVPEAEVSLFLIDSWCYLKDPEQHSWWPQAPVAKAWRHAGLRPH